MTFNFIVFAWKTKSKTTSITCKIVDEFGQLDTENQLSNIKLAQNNETNYFENGRTEFGPYEIGNYYTLIAEFSDIDASTQYTHFKLQTGSATEPTVNNFQFSHGMNSRYGFFKDATGVPVPGVTVSVGTQSTITNSDGFYLLQNMEVGSEKTFTFLQGDIKVAADLTEIITTGQGWMNVTAETEVNLPFIAQDSSGAKNLEVKITRAKLEALVQSLVDRTLEPCKTALKDSGFSAAEINEVVLVGGMTRMPKIIETVKNFFGKEPNKSVNPDEVVAMGAAIQGGVLQGDVKDVLLLDVTPLSLGIETLGGVSTKLIEKNTTIPTKKSQVFSTAEDNQPAVSIRVLQGEREMAADNKILGNFELVGIPPAPRGTPQIEVTFDIDANGIVSVSAKDKGTGKEQKIQIQASGGLSDEEIKKMVKDAEANKEADKKKRETVDARNQADSLVFSTEKSLKEHGNKISAEEKTAIENGITDLKKSLEGTDVEDIKKKTQSLIQASMKLGEAVYKSQQKPDDKDKGSGDPKDAKSSEKDNVVDADFEDVKEDKEKSA